MELFEEMENEKTHKPRGKVFPELRHKQLKEQAMAFYAEHKVQDALEMLLNEMFLYAPVDVYGYMSEYFLGMAMKPTIASFSACEGLDSSGGKSLELDLYCTVNGMDKLVSSISFSMDMYKASEETQITPGPAKGQLKTHRSTAKLQSPSTKTRRPSSKSQSPLNSKARKSLSKPQAESPLGNTPSPAPGPATKSHPPSASSRGRTSSLEQGEMTSSYASTASSSVTPMSALTTITKYVVPALKGVSPQSIQEVDTLLAAITSEDPQQCPHLSALLAASCCAVIAGASFADTPLFLHLARTCRSFFLPSLPLQNAGTPTKAPKKSRKLSNPKFTMPVPVVGALSGGQLGCGKCRFREFCLSPLPGTPFSEQLKMIIAVHTELENCLTAKFGASGRGSLVSGAFCPPLDKPELGLDLIRDAARNAGFELNQGMGVIVDVGADRLFDEERGKYELIAGHWKSSDDVINMYADLLRSHPGLIGFVDPLHHSDIEGWKKLQERLGHNCLLIADQTLRKGLPIEKEPKPESELGDQSSGTNSQTDTDKPSLSYLSCGAVTLEATLTQTLTKASHIKGHSYYLMLKVPPHSTVSTLPADLAVAMQCRFLRMGAPNGLTSTGLLSRLIRIKEELLARKINDTAGAHVFTSTPKSVDD